MLVRGSMLVFITSTYNHSLYIAATNQCACQSSQLKTCKRPRQPGCPPGMRDQASAEMVSMHALLLTP